MPIIGRRMTVRGRSNGFADHADRSQVPDRIVFLRLPLQELPEGKSFANAVGRSYRGAKEMATKKKTKKTTRSPKKATKRVAKRSKKSSAKKPARSLKKSARKTKSKR